MMTTNNSDDRSRDHGIRREDLRGSWAMERQAELRGQMAKERPDRGKLFGLEAAPSLVDRSLTLFRRQPWTLGAGMTFCQAPSPQERRRPGGTAATFALAPPVTEP